MRIRNWNRDKLKVDGVIQSFTKHKSGHHLKHTRISPIHFMFLRFLYAYVSLLFFEFIETIQSSSSSSVEYVQWNNEIE